MATRRDLRSFARRQLRRLDDRISSFLRRVDAGEEKISRIILQAILEGGLQTQKSRRRYTAEVQEVLRDLYKQRDAAIAPLTLDHFELGHRLAQMGLGENFGHTEIQNAALRMLSENLVHDLGAALDTVGRRTQDVFRKEGLRGALEAAQTGDALSASQNMRKKLIRDGITSFTDAAGRRWTLSHYSSMAVKTVTSEAQNLATKLVLVERGFDVVEVNSVTNPCVKVCKKWDGKMASLTGLAEGYPHMEEIPPFHGECRHFIYPVQETLDEARQRLEVMV